MASKYINFNLPLSVVCTGLYFSINFAWEVDVRTKTTIAKDIYDCRLKLFDELSRRKKKDIKFD